MDEQRLLEAIQNTIGKQLTDLQEQVSGLRTEMNERFEAVDRRFEAMDGRFEAIDQRFEAIDQRFEAIDQRFDRLETQVKKNTEAITRQGIKIENEIDKAIKTLQEGHDSLLQALKDKVGSEQGEDIKRELWALGETAKEQKKQIEDIQQKVV